MSAASLHATRVGLSGHFIEASRGRIFVVLRRPPGASDGVIVVPPFAEEMNKSRRMVSKFAEELTSRGWAVVTPDLSCTGDSEGDFGDAGWSIWASDVCRAVDWCGEAGLKIRGLLGIRLGAALSLAALRANPSLRFEKAVLWQPVLDGSRFTTQFLRMRIASQMSGSARRETVADIRARLEAGESVEVAGYRLSGTLMRELDTVVPPERIPDRLGIVRWMEIVREAGGDVPLPAARLIEAARRAGGDHAMDTFVGEPFWATTEIVTNMAMVTATARHFVAAPSLGGGE